MASAATDLRLQIATMMDETKAPESVKAIALAVFDELVSLRFDVARVADALEKIADGRE